MSVEEVTERPGSGVQCVPPVHLEPDVTGWWPPGSSLFLSSAHGTAPSAVPTTPWQCLGVRERPVP